MEIIRVEVPREKLRDDYLMDQHGCGCAMGWVLGALGVPVDYLTYYGMPDGALLGWQRDDLAKQSVIDDIRSRFPTAKVHQVINANHAVVNNNGGRKDEEALAEILRSAGIEFVVIP